MVVVVLLVIEEVAVVVVLIVVVTPQGSLASVKKGTRERLTLE